MNKRVSVWIAGDNPEIIDELQSNLDALGYVTSPIRNGDAANLDLSDNPPDLIIIDLTVCNYSSLSVCDAIMSDEQLSSDTIIIALVSSQSMGQIPLDYDFAEILIYPCDISELGFRLRRTLYTGNNGSNGDTLKFGDLAITPSRYEVKVQDKPVSLSHKEYELLKHLITHRSHVFTREELFGTIWGSSDLGESRTVDVHIRRVRLKIGDLDKQYIKTVRGVGYTFRFENN